MNLEALGLNALAGAIAGVSAGIILKLASWLTRPTLKIFFNPKRTFDIKQVVPSGKQTIFVHLIVNNNRPGTAEGCYCYITKIEKIEHRVFKDLGLPVHLKLAWSNEGVNCFSAIEIPGKTNRRVDLAYIEENSNIFQIHTEPGPRGIQSFFPKGKYRITTQVAGRNTNRAEQKFIFEWNGQWKKEAISITRVK